MKYTLYLDKRTCLRTEDFSVEFTKHNLERPTNFEVANPTGSFRFDGSKQLQELIDILVELQRMEKNENNLH